MSEQRENILEHACGLLVKDGLEGFSMRKLARAIGVTAPALYRHYQSKEALLHAVLSEAYRRMAGHLYEALEGSTPLDRLRLASEGYLSFALAHPQLYEALFAAPQFVGIADLPDEVLAQGCAVGRFWNDRIRECMDTGILQRDDPEAVGLTMWAHAHGMVSLHSRGLLVGGGDEAGVDDFRVLYRASMERMFRGVSPRDARADGDDDLDTAGTAA